MEIDHINGIPSDNRISNLREVSHAQNMQNAKMRADNKSGVTGVSWCKQSEKWIAYICFLGEMETLGRFDVKMEAVRHRREAEERYGFHKNHGKKRQ